LKLLFIITTLTMAAPVLAATIKVDVNIMPRVTFTGDSQTCGRVGALDYPQMLSWEMPIRVLNTGVGGTNTRQLLSETSGGSACVKKGEKAVKGTKVPWHAGPYPGQKIRLGAHEYVIDRIETVSYKDQLATIWITEPANEDFEGTDYAIEAGWRVRIAERRPDYACFMYSVNDTGWKSEEFQARLAEIVKRTRALGAQPIFLSGVPLMDASKGGSHPAGNARVDVRANDLKAFCSEHKIPFGDVFHALMLLDEQCTAVWVDTVHPTTDGSTAILNALRSIFRDLSLAQNPYYVRGYKSSGALSAPNDTLIHFTTSQPDYTAQNVQNENQFDLAAIKARDEYGLIAAADGDVVESETPIVLKFGVGDAGKITSARAEIVVASEATISWFDWDEKAWKEIAHGSGKLEAPLPPTAIAKGCRDGAIWLAVRSPKKVALDYAALTLEGDLSRYEPHVIKEPIFWPKPEEIEWRKDGNLIKNGNLVAMEGEAPTLWRKSGPQAFYLRAGVVAKGTGAFSGDKHIDLFKSAGWKSRASREQKFSKDVRPLDVLNIPEGPADAKGQFIISHVVDDETLRVRRFPKAAVSGLEFEVTRTSGCAAVQGGCLVQCRGESYWETIVPRLKAGAYRIEFFYRAYDPANMTARATPGDLAKVEVRLKRKTLATADGLPTSFQWQKAHLDFTMPREGEVCIRVRSKSDTPVEYTGFTLVIQP
jgi:hypothetical protein